MRVLHVITGLAAGGAETQLRGLLRYTRAEAEVACLTNPGAVAEDIRAQGVPVHCVRMTANTDVAAVGRLARLIRNGRFDVVHAHLYRAMLYGRVAARLAGVTTVVGTEHSLGEKLIEGRPVDRIGVRALYRAGERLGQTTIAVSEGVADLLGRWGVPANRIRVIPNGIDPAAFHSADPAVRTRFRSRFTIPLAAPVVGYVGRLADTKQLPLLLAAVRQLPEVWLLLVGDGPAAHQLSELAHSWGIAERVVFAGETSNVAAGYAAMDIHVNPSPAEAFGLAALEALAAGLPSVYTCCPALDELPAWERPAPTSARRVPGDAAVLRDTITELLAHPRRATAEGQVPERYHIGATAAQVDDLYAQLLRRPSAPHRPPYAPASSSRLDRSRT
jgi:glycosyltransferase involved in cell wall biosynthesis